MAQRDYYEVLGVARTASDQAIKNAYRKLAKQYHPDRNRSDPAAADRFKAVQEAYDVLSTAEKRRRYDQFGHAGVDPRAAGPAGRPRAWSSSGPGGAGFDVGGFGGGMRSVFDQVFGGGMGGRGRGAATPPPSRDVEVEATLSFEEAIHGTSRTIELSGPAGSERQRIEVKIPAGVDDGRRIRVKGQGASGHGGAGDLYLTVHVTGHRYFRREGSDILLNVPVTIAEAALGARISLPTIDGPTMVTIPPGASGGKRLRLRGKGLPAGAADGRGDQYCLIRVVVPEDATAEQRELLERLRETGLGDPREDQGW